jgi:hypothetical protein
MLFEVHRIFTGGIFRHARRFDFRIEAVRLVRGSSHPELVCRDALVAPDFGAKPRQDSVARNHRTAPGNHRTHNRFAPKCVKAGQIETIEPIETRICDLAAVLSAPPLITVIST